MSFLPIILLLLLCLPIIILLAILLLPVNYSLNAGNMEQFHFQFNINWSYIISWGYDHKTADFSFKILFFNIRHFPSKTKPSNHTDTADTGKKSAKSPKNTIHEPNDTGNQTLTLILTLADVHFLAATLKLLSNLVKSVKPKIVYLQAKIGFSEPYYTGLFMSLLSFSSASAPITFDVQPLWQEEIFDIDLFLTGRIVILLLVAHLLKYLFDPAVRQIICRLRKLSAELKAG